MYLNNIDKLIDKLQNCPLYYLSLSSKELFHTNFWYWLSILNGEETVKLFSKTLLRNPIFKREYKASFDGYKSVVDLYITSGDISIVIENKVKDFPKPEQLKRIVDSFGDKKIEFILTTLFGTNDTWPSITYKEISERIIPNNFTSDEYYKKLIEDYKEFILNLANIAELLEPKEEYDFANSLNKDLFRKLNEIKLWESYQKLRASHLTNKFAKSNIHDLKVDYYIHNQKATIDFVIKLRDDYSIGISIEDLQYRKFILGINAKDLASKLISKNVFLSSKFLGRGKKQYLNYGENYKYQYEKIGKITFDELFKKINNDIEIIKLNKKEIEDQISLTKY